jgi:hypothetical protein
LLNLSFLIFKEKIKFEIDVIGQDAVKIFKKFVGMSNQYLANLTAEERQFKLSVLGENNKLPSILLDDEDDLVLANKAKLSIKLDINRSKLYMRGNFESKEKPNFQFDNPTNIQKVRDFFERPEYSTQGGQLS